MFAVQQHTNSFIPDALKQGLVLQQGQAQAWLQAGGQPQHMMRAGGPQQAGLLAHQTPQQVVYQQQPQQVRMQMPITTAQLQPPQQQQQFMMAAPQQFAPQPAGPNATLGAVQDGNKQVVYVNVGGALRRGIVQNGAVYLLPEDAATRNGQRPQVGAMPVGNGGRTVQHQPQQPMMVQQVMSNGQMMPVSGAMVAPRGGMQLLPSQQLQVQPQAPPAQLQAQGMPMGFSAAMQQHQLRMDMGATAAANQRMLPANTGAPFVTSVGPNARVLQQQQHAAMLQMPQAAAARGPAALASVMRSGQMLGGNSVSASTASLMPRMPASSAAPGPAPAGSQPMTIAAALAALPTNATPGSAAAPGNDLCSPVAPPGTPGMGSGPVGSAAVSTIGAVISKLAAADAGVAGPAIISGPAIMGVPAGTSPLTSQPGTPPRSNSVGHHSSSSSSSGGSETDSEAKAGMMRMLARTFIETGIGLQQALGMIQPADAEMLAAAFAAEVAEASAARAPVRGAGGDKNTECPAGGVAALGADTNTNTRIEGAGVGLSNTSFGGSVGGEEDSCSLGSWGFSLFSNVTSEMGSQQGGSSFGGIGDKVIGASSACAADAATATMFANLHV